MMKGFSIIEVMLTMTISLVIMSLVITNVTETARYTRRVNNSQQVMQSLFLTMEAIHSDLKKCGERLQEAGKHFNIPVFEYAPDHIKVVYGLQCEVLEEDVDKGEKTVTIRRNSYFTRGKAVLIYHIKDRLYEFNEIKEVDGDNLVLTAKLTNAYRKGSDIVALRQVEYKHYNKQNVLKRKLDRGYFQPLTENCSAFHIIFYPETRSVLYRVEVNKREQLRGYVFLKHMVKK